MTLLITAALAALFATTSINSIPNQNPNIITLDENIELLEANTDELTTYEISQFNLNVSELKNTTYVYSQKETIEIMPETYSAPEGLAFDINGNLVTYDDGLSNEYTEPGGYVTMITTAYRIGFYDGHPLYKSTFNIKTHKKFIFNKTDSIVLRTGQNSAFYDGITAKGINKLYRKSNDSLIKTENLKPKFSQGPGAVYDFQLQTEVPGTINSIAYHDIYGEYYFVATDTTSVQSVYIHNQGLFSSISFTFDFIGVSIDLNKYTTESYYATPLTIPAYSSEIETNSATISPNQYGFESQYFFYEKKKEHQINSLNFSTKRLRCGFIENEYIILSPLRTNAGIAYLEFSFETPIYRFTTELCYWSASEYLKPQDKAYIQYKDQNGEWVTLLDIINDGNLPTNRLTPKTFEFNIIDGTKELRFYSSVNSPSSSRNKGRICIGETSFTSYTYK